MQNKITIILHPNKTSVDWLITGDSVETQFAIADDLSRLHPGKHDKVTAIIPGQDVFLTTVTLPRLRPSRLRQALPYAIEEELLDEPEALHIAHGPYQADQSLPVAIIKKSVLEAWLHLLQQQGIRPATLIPSPLALPFQDKQWQVGHFHDTISVRTGLYSGFSCDPANLDLLLSLKQEEEKSSPAIKHLDSNTPLILSLDVDNTPFINLLQGPYTPPPPMIYLAPQNKKAWRITAFALLICLALLLIKPLGETLLLRCKHHHLQQQLGALYQRYQIPSLAPEAKTRLKATLKKTLTENQASLFLSWLAVLADNNASIRIDALHFKNQRLIVELTTSTHNSVEAFIASLQSQGLQAILQTTALSGNQVKARLMIERGMNS